MSERLNTHSAFIYVMVVIAASDRQMTDRELKTIGAIVQTVPVFQGFDTDNLISVAQGCAQMLAESNGLDAVLSRVREAVPERLRETGYALAAEVAAADGRFGPEERRLLDLIRGALHIDALAAAAIEHGARVRQARL